MSGAEDTWPAYAAWISTSVAYENPATVISPGGVTVFNALAMWPFNGIELHITPLTPGPDPVQVTLAFQYDTSPADGTPLTQTFMVISGSTLDVVIPVAAQYVTVILASLTAGNVTAAVYAAPVVTAGGFRFINAHPEVLGTNIVFPVGPSTTIVPLPALLAASAYFFAAVDDSSGMLDFHVHTLSSTGGKLNLLFECTPASPGAPVALMMRIPAQPVGVVVINNDTVNTHTGSYALIPAPAGC